MRGENPQKQAKAWKISNGLLVFALASVFCLGPIIHPSRGNDSTPIQRLGSLGNYDLKDRLLGYITPTPNYALRSAGTFLSTAHYATISDNNHLLERPSLARLIESASRRFQAEIKMDSTLKVRAPPLFFSDKSIL